MQIETTTQADWTAKDLEAPLSISESTRIAPPFYGWQAHVHPRLTPPGFWTAHRHKAQPGELVAQLGREDAASTGYFWIGFQRFDIQAGYGDTISTEIEAISLSRIGHGVDLFAYLLVSGRISRAGLWHRGQRVRLSQDVRFPGRQVITVGTYLVLRPGGRYGESIVQINDLSQGRVVALGAADGDRLRVATRDDDGVADPYAGETLAQLAAAEPCSDGQPIAFCPVE